MKIKKTPFDKFRVFFDLKRGRLGLGFFLCSDVYKRTRDDLTGEILDLLGLEFDESVDESKEGVIFTLLYILAWVKLSSTLADDDVSDRNGLIAEYFDAETLGNRITAEGG